MAGIAINTNIASLTAQRRFSDSTSRLRESFEKLSSGLRISRSADDAAGLAVASRLKVDSRVYTQALRNINDGVSALSIAEGALEQISSISQRQIELAEQAANGTLSAAQRRALTAEANSLAKEYNRIVQTVGFNGKLLLQSTTSGSTQIQAGYGQDGSVTFELGQQLSRLVGSGEAVLGASMTTGYYVNVDLELSDVNDDGKLDLIQFTREEFTNSAVVAYLGNGDGTFQAGTTLDTTGIDAPTSIHVEDVNGDGRKDLIVAGGESGAHIGVSLGNNDGTFRAPVISAQATYGGATPGAYADFNRDGKLDVLLFSSGYGQASLFLGQGNGQFTLSEFDLGGCSVDVEVGDFNGDSNLDLAFVDSMLGPTNHMSLVYGNGDGTFKAAVSIAGAPEGTTCDAGDLNNDGFSDLFVAAGNGSRVYLGGPSGITFGTQQIGAGVISGSTRPVLADLNGDGIEDLLAADSYDRSHLWFGNGDGSFRSAGSFDAGVPEYLLPGALAVGDINNDGVPDFAVGTIEADLQVALACTTRVTTAPLLDLFTQESARSAIPALKSQLARVASELGTIGAAQSRLGTALSNLQVARENFDSAASQILDTDIAVESAKLLRTQILQQAGSAILAQANQAPALALKLLGS